jgi:phytoene dehydrogenase-like protein
VVSDGRVVVVGGGHNGLVTAALLAKAGLRPLVLERRETLGGAAVTEEFHPGYRCSTVAHTAGPFRASLVQELGLGGDGLAFISPEPRVFAPLPDGRSVRLWGNAERSAGDIHRLSPRDAERYPAMARALAAVARVLAKALAATPPDVDHPRPRDLWPFLDVGLGLRRLDKGDALALMRWAPMAVADFAAEWFEAEPLRALVCGRGVFGCFAGPWSAGTTANLLLQAAAGGGDLVPTVLVRGGLGALTRALGDSAQRHGAEVRTGTEVERFLAENGTVTGVVLAGGEEIRARAVVSGLDPHRTFLRLLDPALLDPDELRRIRNYRIQGACAKVNLALSALPAFAAVKDEDPRALLGGRIHVGPDVDSIERAFDEAKYGGIARQPFLEATLPSLTDPSLVPPGAHAMSVHVQYTPYRLAQGDWPSRRAELLGIVLDRLEEYAPGLRGLVVGSQVLTPHDLEATYGLTGGHPYHGEHALDQLFFTRPLLGWGRYRGPLPGLYLCGAGTHPGGGVTGAPGANAAREVLRDLR